MEAGDGLSLSHQRIQGKHFSPEIRAVLEFSTLNFLYSNTDWVEAIVRKAKTTLLCFVLRSFVRLSLSKAAKQNASPACPELVEWEPRRRASSVF